MAQKRFWLQSRTATLAGLALLGGASLVVLRRARASRQAADPSERVLASLRPPQEIDDLFRDPERLRAVLPVLERVEPTEDAARWRVRFGGHSHEREMRLAEHIPGRRLLWRFQSQGQDHTPPELELELNLETLPFERGTAMRLAARGAGNGMMGKLTSLELQAALLRARALLEAGEIPTIEGQPRGHFSAAQLSPVQLGSGKAATP